MSEVYYPGDYVKFSLVEEVDYGTVVRMGTHSDPNNPNHVLVAWEGEGGGLLHAALDCVSLVRRAAEQEFNKTSDEMSVSDLKKFLEKLDDNMYVSGIHSLSFHFGKGS